MPLSRPPFVGSVGGWGGSAGVCSDIQPRLKIAPQTLSFRLVQGGLRGQIVSSGSAHTHKQRVRIKRMMSSSPKAALVRCGTPWDPERSHLQLHKHRAAACRGKSATLDLSRRVIPARCCHLGEGNSSCQPANQAGQRVQDFVMTVMRSRETSRDW